MFSKRSWSNAVHGMRSDRPWQIDGARHHVAATADVLATTAADDIFERGGSAVDAAIAANAVLCVTGPHLCGLGGDLFAIVQTRDGAAVLNASGRAGSRCDADSMRASGLTRIPLRHHRAAVTIPGCVDGWVALSQRYGHLSLAEVLEPAVHLATAGFETGPLLFRALGDLDDLARPRFAELTDQAVSVGARVMRPGIARTLETIGRNGRDAFYLGEFGDGLVHVTESWITADDLSHDQATWHDPLSIDLWGCTINTAAPNSQAYLTLATVALAAAIGLPDDPTDPRWAHVLIEATLAAGEDRDEMLVDSADGRTLLEDAAGRHRQIPLDHASRRRVRFADGDTTAISTADTSMAVSLIQSNAAGFGSWLVEPSTSINLHNRGIGFSLRPGHDTELRAGRRPAHTLSPTTVSSRAVSSRAVSSDALSSGADTSMIAAIGTMGGDAQPQIVAQLLARLVHHRHNPTDIIAAPRWVLRGANAFDTWAAESSPSVLVEAEAGWTDDLRRLGHEVIEAAGVTGAFGHAQLAWSSPERLAAAADPRSVIGGTLGR